MYIVEVSSSGSSFRNEDVKGKTVSSAPSLEVSLKVGGLPGDSDGKLRIMSSRDDRLWVSRYSL